MQSSHPDRQHHLERHQHLLPPRSLSCRACQVRSGFLFSSLCSRLSRPIAATDSLHTGQRQAPVPPSSAPHSPPPRASQFPFPACISPRYPVANSQSRPGIYFYRLAYLCVRVLCVQLSSAQVARLIPPLQGTCRSGRSSSATSNSYLQVAGREHKPPLLAHDTSFRPFPRQPALPSCRPVLLGPLN